MIHSASWLLTGLLLLGCGGVSGAPGVDGASRDAGSSEAGSVDGGLVDGGPYELVDATSFDAGLFDGDVQDAAIDDAATLPTPLCEVNEARIACVRRTTRLQGRDVHFQWPSAEPPLRGYPVVFLFQGSASPAGLAWVGQRDAPFGGYYQADVIRALLEAGFAVVTPEASLEGAGAWNTNVAPWNFAWESSPDHALMVALLEAVETGELGPLDPARLFAAGLSSGGYMSSRVAVSYEGRFVRIAVASASYATCAGSVCRVPRLDPAHPPTLFLHGARDAIVPAWTMRLYASELAERAVGHEVVVDPEVDHAWIPASAERVVAFFRAGL